MTRRAQMTSFLQLAALPDWPDWLYCLTGLTDNCPTEPDWSYCSISPTGTARLQPDCYQVSSFTLQGETSQKALLDHRAGKGQNGVC